MEFQIQAPGPFVDSTLDIRPNNVANIIPEPGTAALALAGVLPLLGCAVARRRSAAACRLA